MAKTIVSNRLQVNTRFSKKKGKKKNLMRFDRNTIVL